MKHKPLQLTLPLDLLKPIEEYIKGNKRQYRKDAKIIVPDLNEPRDVWTRIAFSILSANAPFETSVRGLDYALGCYDTEKDLDGWALTSLGALTANKADYINALPRNRKILSYCKQADEGWHSYRLRLQKSIKGLGLTKASFTACLLYPLKADLACIDTWIQKVFLGRTGWKQIGLKDYLQVEEKIREIAKRYRINTFLCQWLIWDFRRGNVTSHDIFPSAHKGVE